MSDQEDFLITRFSSSSQPLKQRWHNKGLSASFIADYLYTFFISKDGKASVSAHTKNAAKYIANELLENAMKFSNGDIDYPTTMSFIIRGNTVFFYTANSIAPEIQLNFQHYLRKLLADDPHALYIQQMENNAKDVNSTCSGLGFLSMICDYKADIAWKFSNSSEPCTTPIVTTMVRMDI
nr:ATP-binding protein [Candidatus Venteria ishoeyi]